MFKKKEQPKVIFETEHWFVRKYAPIRPASEFIPDYWKNIPTYIEKKEHPIDGTKTVKACPAVADLMTAGYVLPAWCDIELEPDPNDPKKEVVYARYSSPYFNHAIHGSDQVGPVLEHKFNIRSVIRLDNPWKMWCAPGYSLMYQPLYYWPERNWEALPGILDQDKGGIVSVINTMMKKPVKTVIKQGEPIVQIIPFRREPFTAVTRSLSQDGIARANAINGLHKMLFKGWRSLTTEKKIYDIENLDTDLPGDIK